MLRRLFSSISVKKLNCSDCRLYNQTTKICKINKLSAFENRLDENICGFSGKKFWPLDKTYLIKSKRYNRYSAYFRLLAMVSIPTAILIDYRFLLSSPILYYLTNIFSDMSKKCERNFFDDGKTH